MFYHLDSERKFQRKTIYTIHSSKKKQKYIKIKIKRAYGKSYLKRIRDTSKPASVLLLHYSVGDLAGISRHSNIRQCEKEPLGPRKQSLQGVRRLGQRINVQVHLFRVRQLTERSSRHYWNTLHTRMSSERSTRHQPLPRAQPSRNRQKRYYHTRPHSHICHHIRRCRHWRQWRHASMSRKRRHVALLFYCTAGLQASSTELSVPLGF